MGNHQPILRDFYFCCSLYWAKFFLIKESQGVVPTCSDVEQFIEMQPKKFQWLKETLDSFLGVTLP